MTHSESARPGRHPRQNQLLAAAAVLIVAALVLVLVVVLRGGSDGPTAGSPDAVTDQFASAVQAHDSARIDALSCAANRAAVARPLRGLLRDLRSATRSGEATVRSDLAVVLIGVRTSTSSSGSITVALRKLGTTWCVASVAVSLPTHA